MLFVNYKTYEEGTGEAAVGLTEILDEVATSSEIKIIPVVQAGDIREIVQMTKLEVWAQHIDPIDFGAHTGAIIPQEVFEDGAVGTFLNHSERKFGRFSDLTIANRLAQKVGLKTLVFAADIDELKKVIDLRPTFVAYEPPELVGSKTTSVSQAKPDVIAKAVDISKKAGLPLIVGAGIKSTEDVITSVSLGAVGVAVASDIVKSENPKEAVLELVEGFE